MQIELVSFRRGLVGRLLESVYREIRISWQFIYRDISSAIVPELLFLLAALNSQSLPAIEWIGGLARGLLYFYLYLFSFCLSNQIVGIEEDRINKPDRPLVTGAVSHHGAIVRLAIGMALSLGVAWLWGVLEWAILWQVFVILYNFGRAGTHWLTRNLVIAGATVAQLAPAWQLIRPITPIAWHWILMAAGMWLLLGAVQDLRDIEGDRVIHRKTLPLVVGEIPCRILLISGFIVFPIVFYFALMMSTSWRGEIILGNMVLAVISWSIAVRILVFRSPQADDMTYKLFTYLYCSIPFIAIFTL
ncbi:UbiA family prenyltransferase [Pannus brasiliensis CCIBt3594]|uniref:UbiA family prenyltransferase n=1 Tax=Pannus brasiliensis CCIBt3594 TaxID=1427578 RepID=A0AAW9QPY6_9CHRO